MASTAADDGAPTDLYEVRHVGPPAPPAEPPAEPAPEPLDDAERQALNDYMPEKPPRPPIRSRIPDYAARSRYASIAV